MTRKIVKKHIVEVVKVSPLEGIISLDKDTGKFWCEFRSQMYEHKELEKLRYTVKDVLTEAREWKWEPKLVIRTTSRGEGESWGNNIRTFRSAQVRFEWFVCRACFQGEHLYILPFKDELGFAPPTPRRIYDSGGGWVYLDHTPELEARVKALAESLKNVQEKFDQLFANADTITAMLTGTGLQLGMDQ